MFDIQTHRRTQFSHTYLISLADVSQRAKKLGPSYKVKQSVLPNLYLLSCFT